MSDETFTEIIDSIGVIVHAVEDILKGLKKYEAEIKQLREQTKAIVPRRKA